MAVSITPQNFEQEITQEIKPIILDVHAIWCGPCQQMEPVLEELESEVGDKYKFAKLNVDEAREISIKYGVTSVPTFIFIKNNEVKGKETGYMGKDVLLEKIEEYLGK
jgi:thioredoxin 1